MSVGGGVTWGPTGVGVAGATEPEGCVLGVGWSYDRPNPAYAALAGYLAFYAGRVDEAWVGAERATAQPGGFYGGWVTSRIVGPMKGGPGSFGW